MNIAYITSSAPTGNGESFVITEIIALAHRASKIIIVPTVTRGADTGTVTSDKTTTFYAPLISPLSLWNTLIFLVLSPASSFRILSLVFKSRSLPIAIKNMAVIPKAITTSRLFKKKRISHIHAHWASTPSTMALMIHYISGIPWSMTTHRWDIIEDNLLQIKVGSAKFTRAISNSGLDMIKARLVKNSGSVKLLHMGVSIPIHQYPTSEQLIQNRTILCPAALTNLKGQEVLIRAIAALKENLPLELILAGDGPQFHALQSLSEQLDCSDLITFLGHIHHDQVINLYRENRISATVLPSLDLGNDMHEGIPVSLMEAMSFCVPVVSTRTGGIPELLGGGAGILVNAGDSDQMASALQTLFHNKSTFDEVRWKGLKKVKREFNVDTTSETLAKWFVAAEKSEPENAMCQIHGK